MTNQLRTVSLCLLSAFVITFAASSEAATYFVSPTGSDSNSGTAASPWATPQKAADTMVAGDVVLVEPGTYRGFHTFGMGDGNPSNPIIFRANGAGVILDRDNSSTSDVINIENSDYVVVEGFIVEGGSRAGIRVVLSTGVLIRQNTVGPNGKWGIFTAFAPKVEIRDNICFGAGTEHGIYVSNSDTANDDPVVAGNVLYGNAHNGIQFNGDCHSGGDGIITGAIIENNFVYENGWKGLSLISMANSIVRNNVIVDNGLDAGAGGIHLTNEPGCNNPSDNNIVSNNTVLESRLAAMRITDDARNNLIFNNIAIGRNSSDGIVDEVGGNQIDASSNIEVGSRTDLFVDASGADYHLAAASAALDAGVSSFGGVNAPTMDFEGASRPQGAGYDIGAYEGAGTPDSEPPTVSITSPVASETISGTFQFVATASDNIRVAGVQFRVDGSDVGGEDTTTPFTLDFDTWSVSNGAHAVSAVARDGAGNQTVSGSVNVTVDNSDVVDPTVNMLSPLNGATVSGTIQLSANASDNLGVAGVTFRLDGADFGAEDLVAPYSIDLNTTTLSDGLHTASAVARDQAGNTGNSGTISFTVDNSIPPPPPPPGEVSVDHPRMYMTPTRLAEMRAMACFDDNGNSLPGCTPSPYWAALLDHMDSGKAEAWNFALAWLVSGDVSYRTTAVSMALDRMRCSIPCAATERRFLNYRFYMWDMALCYDWLYDYFTPSERDEFVNNFALLTFLVWNDNTLSNSIYDHGDWAKTDPLSNYFWSFLLGTAYAAIATWHEDPMTFSYGGQTYPLDIDFDPDEHGVNVIRGISNILFAKLDNLAIPDYLEHPEGGRGGGWHEGNSYGLTSKRMILEAYYILMESGGRDYIHTTEFPREALLYQLYQTQPGDDVGYPAGDMSREGTMGVSAYDRIMFLVAASAFEGMPESQYSQHWVEHPDIFPIMRGISFTTAFDMLFYRPSLPSRNWDDLPLSYHAPGQSWVNSRSSWERDAVSVTFNSTERIKGHMHMDQNHISIFKGHSKTSQTGREGWLIGDISPFTSSLPRYTHFHNTILLDYNGELIGQRHGPGTGDIVKYEAGNGFTYMVGDASDAYDEFDGDSYYNGTPETDMLDVWHREIAHISPGYVVMYDRITQRQKYAAAKPMFLLHYPFNPPTLDGTLLTYVGGEGKLFHEILEPANPTINFVDDDTRGHSKTVDAWSMEMTDPQTRSNYTFLSVFYATSAATAAMPPVARVSSTEGNMVGAQINDGAREIVALFSADPFGVAPSGSVTYEVSMETGSTHHLHNMPPDTQFDVQIVRNERSQLIVVAPGSGPYRSSENGVLVFHVGHDGGAARELISVK